MPSRARGPPLPGHAHLEGALGDARHVAPRAGRVRGADGERASRPVLGGGASAGVLEARGGGHGGAEQVYRGQVQVGKNERDSFFFVAA